MNAASYFPTITEAWWTYVLHSFWQSSLVAVLAFAVVWILRKRSAAFLYAILVVALIKFLIPPIIPAPVLGDATQSVARYEDFTVEPFSPASFESMPVDDEAIEAEAATGAATPSKPIANATSPPTSVQPSPVIAMVQHWKFALAVVHALGAVVLAMLMANSYMRLRRLLRHARPADNALLKLKDDVAARMNVRQHVELLIAPDTCAPMATGILKRRILLPDALSTLDDGEMRAILAHELAHHRRLDLVFVWLEHLVGLVWWFNPVVWLLIRAIHRKRENCCDDVVLEMGLAGNCQYCRTLLRAAKQLQRSTTPGLVFGCANKLHPLGQRLTRIMDTAVRRHTALTLSGIAGVILLGLIVLPTFLPVAAEPENSPPEQTQTALPAKSEPQQSGAEPDAALIGVVHGAVRNTVTGEAVPEAFVAIDHTGDAGGSNLERFHNEGLYVTTQTDTEGQFVLDKVAVREGHPFYVTATGFVRHEETLALTAQEPIKNLEIKLTPGASVGVKVQGDAGAPLENILLRLSANDGRKFLPPKGDWPAWPYRVELAVDGTYEFNELAPGQFRIEAIRTRPQVLTYLGVTEIELAQGESKSVQIQGTPRNTTVTLTVDPDPYRIESQGPLLAIGPAMEVPLEQGFFVHPEAAVLGQIIANALMLDPNPGVFVKTRSLDFAQPIEVKGLPPGNYTVFLLSAGQYPNFKSMAAYPRWTTFDVRDHESVAAHIAWTEPKGPSVLPTPPEVAPTATRTEQDPVAPRPAIIPPESRAVVDRLPGELVFHATYHHRSRGQDFSVSSMVWVKRASDGAIIAASYMPTMNTTFVAYTKGREFYRYESYGHGRDGAAPYKRIINLGAGTVTVTNEGGDKDGQLETLTVPTDAVFQPNTRPDPYAAQMAQFFRTQPLESWEGNWYDWDNSGKGMASYKSRIEYKGEESVTVPAGTFTAHHYIETQTTFGDTWFKKRPDHVTEYWVLNNGVTVRILRHREPYELLLATFDSPTPLPGITELSTTASPIAIAEAPTGNASVSVSVVHGETGAPVPAVNVFVQGGPNRAVQRSGTADDNGQFTFDALPAGQYAVGCGTSKGFSRGARENVSLDSDDAKIDVILKLDPGVYISGRVIDLESKPIAGATVFARSWDEGGNFNTEVAVNTDGAYEIAGVPRGGNYRLYGKAPGHYSGHINVNANGDVKGVDFKLGDGATVSGRAVDTEGRAVRDAQIGLQPDLDSWREKEGEMNLSWGSQVQLSDEGQFEFQNVAPGKYRFHLLARRANQGFEQTSVGDWIDVAIGAELSDVQAVFPDSESERIEGTVRDETGAPVANVNVDAITYEGMHWSAKTDAEGRYKLVGLGDHTFDIYFMHDVHPDVKLPKVRPGAYNADVVMPHAGRITGAVFNEVDGKPVQEGSIEIVWHVPEYGLARGYRSERQGGSMRQDGTFEMDGILPGTLYLKVSAPGYLEKQSPAVTIKAGQTTEKVEVKVTPAAIVEGTVLAGGKPLDVEQGIRVMCLDEPIHEVPAGYIIHEGKYRLDRLPAGTYEISAWARGRGHMADEVKTIQVTAGQIVGLDFVLDFPAVPASR